MFNLARKNREYLFFTIMVYIYFLIIITLTVLVFDSSGELIADDKLVHFGAFSLLSFTLYLVLSVQIKNMLLKKYPAFFTILIVSLFGIIIELFQLLIPGRSSDVFDWIANTFGSLFTILMIKFLSRVIKKLKRNSI
jgi:VanZ family protein